MQEKYRILVCDDDFDIVSAVAIYLEKAGYEAIHAYNGAQALEILEKQKIHLLILDIMMPLMDGIETLKKIREKRSLPVILLSAKGENNDKIEGLDQGADDYITKPFNSKELLARVKSQLRRYTEFSSYDPESGNDEFVKSLGDLYMNKSKGIVRLEDRELQFTPLEFDLLWFFIKHPGKIFSSEELYKSVWKEDVAASVATVAVHIRHIREKIEIDPKNPRYIKVVWGKGYKMEEK